MSLFTHVVSKIPKRNRFRQPFETIHSANFGELRVLEITELDPGNTFIDQIGLSIKCAPMKAPAFGRIDATLHYFFVPRRLLYDEFEQFITGGVNGTFAQDVSELNPVAPSFSFEDLALEGKLADGSLADDLGLPYAEDQGTYVGIPPIDAMPFAAYHKIFSDWYRDELLDQDEFEPLKSEVQDAATSPLLNHRYRAWRKDYFTSARPDTQLGPSVGIPIAGDLTADGAFRLKTASSISDNRYVTSPAGSQEVVEGSYFHSLNLLTSTGSGSPGNLLSYGDGISLDNAYMLIQDLRKGLRLQEFREKNMRGGNRYIENIFHHFGVKSSDARLQRSQYLGGRSVPVVIGEVLQSVDTRVTSEGTTTGNPLGQRGGVANAGGASQRIKYFAEEHGFVLAILSIMPHALYYQGIPRMFAARWDPMDYAWPEFGNLGEQEVYNWELYVAQGQNSGNAGVFGYQSRYADRKFRPSTIHGEFRHGQLMSWHTARQFTNRPQLNASFVYFPSDQYAGGANRIFVVESNNEAAHFYVHAWHELTIVQHLPKYGIPSL